MEIKKSGQNNVQESSTETKQEPSSDQKVISDKQTVGFESQDVIETHESPPAIGELFHLGGDSNVDQLANQPLKGADVFAKEIPPETNPSKVGTGDEMQRYHNPVEVKDESKSEEHTFTPDDLRFKGSLKLRIDTTGFGNAETIQTKHEIPGTEDHRGIPGKDDKDKFDPKNHTKPNMITGEKFGNTFEGERWNAENAGDGSVDVGPNRSHGGKKGFMGGEGDQVGRKGEKTASGFGPLPKGWTNTYGKNENGDPVMTTKDPNGRTVQTKTADSLLGKDIIKFYGPEYGPSADLLEEIMPTTDGDDGADPLKPTTIGDKLENHVAHKGGLAGGPGGVNDPRLDDLGGSVASRYDNVEAQVNQDDKQMTDKHTGDRIDFDVALKANRYTDPKNNT